MRQGLTSFGARMRDTFTEFTLGQKVVAVLGTLGLLLAGFMVFRWASTPDYSPLYSNLNATDASSVVEELDKQGVKYQLADNGGTVMVPKDQVYATRISLSGQGIPTGGDTGYNILDGQDLTTSKFGEQTAFKRAMEGELAKTIAAMDPVSDAVVHLALPEKEVFADEQAPPTASVLLRTGPGETLSSDQVQAIVHLVASSIDNLKPENVTISDASGKLLTTNDDASGAANSRAEQRELFTAKMRNKIQATLDRVLGPNNATVEVTAELDFDEAQSETRTFTPAENTPPLSETNSTETYTGPGDRNGTTGVVGPDGQMDDFGAAPGADSAYSKESTTRDNPVNSTVEKRVTAPGGVKSVNVGVMLDARAAGALDTNELARNISAMAGLNRDRGDRLRVSTMPFDRSAEDAMNAELKAAEDAAAADKRNELIRDVGLVVFVALLVLFAWWQQRRRARARAEATSYLVEQLREDAAARANVPAVEANTALLALEGTEQNEAERLHTELVDLVERQPEEVAALLRGWLVAPK
ncbi:flagellar basal-body MS-ring/collar protein FliF [Nocardioides sp. Bht2]|uniref:flagellar basal-body MS-ring/collar protein FliF n=1 Tax=Nocardioides sp. Bht2 TaxID=3392297 RepID=UPI0039B54924